MREAVISFPFLNNLTINPPSYISIGNFKIYFYGIIIAIGFILAILFAQKWTKKFGPPMDRVYDLIIWAVIAAVIGARLYYVVFNYSLYKDDFLSIFKIRDGGLAIYGGVIFAALAVIIRSRQKKWKIWPSLDLMGMGLLIGQTAGRWGNFFNREAYGYETDIFCRMGLTLPGKETFYVHPTFLYESLWNAIGFCLMCVIAKKRRKYEGQFFLLYLFWYGLGRMCIEGLRSDSLWLIPDKIRVSQLLAALCVLVAGFLMLANNKRLAAGKAPLCGSIIGAEEIKETDNSEATEETESPDATIEDDNPEVTAETDNSEATEETESPETTEEANNSETIGDSESPETVESPESTPELEITNKEETENKNTLQEE